MDESPSVEAILGESAASTKPILLAPQTNKPKAKRRWMLLKNVNKARQRFNSLTKNEKEFLDILDEKPTEELEKSGQGDKRRQRLRESIRSSMDSREMSLTARERKFLGDLVKSEKISTDYLANTVTVLERDPRFKADAIEEEEEQAEGARPSKDLTAHHSIGFRTEIWDTSTETLDHQKCVYNATSVRNMSLNILEENETEETKEETPVEPEKKEEKGLKGFFSSIGHAFAPLRGPSSKEEEAIKRKAKMDADEETVNEDETYSILATSVQNVDCHPHVMSPLLMEALRPHLPFTVREDNFWLKYSLVRDGASMRALIRKIRSTARTILAIETMDGDVFGAFVSSPWHPDPKGYYGSAEAFLWRIPKSRFSGCKTMEDQAKLESALDVYKWSQKNRNIQSLASADGNLVIGGGGPDDNPSAGGGSGLSISSDIHFGFSEDCVTFDCPRLPPSSGKDGFEIASMEVWALTPVNNVEQAEKLELGRQFVFDHGNFVQS